MSARDSNANPVALSETDANSPRLREKSRFFAALCGLGVLALGCVWGVAFLPMQDHPQHLFVAHALATFDDATLRWSDAYTRELRIAPYIAYYGFAAGFGRLIGVELATKLFLSLYVALAWAFVATEARTRSRAQPWSLLLVFPLLFSPIYFMGFHNYLLSLPVLLFALRAQRRSAERAERAVAPLLWVAALFFLHPFSNFVYVGLALAAATLHARDTGAFRRALVPPLCMLGLIAAWHFYAVLFDPAAVSAGEQWRAKWWSPIGTVAYLLLQFSGMRISVGPSWLVVPIWLAVFALLGASAWRARSVAGRDGTHAGGGPDSEDAAQGVGGRGSATRGVEPVPEGSRTSTRDDTDRARFARRWATLLGSLALAAYFVLPFGLEVGLGIGTYLNLRLAPLVLLFFAIALSFVRVAPAAQVGLVVAPTLLLGLSFMQQRAISDEIAELAPLLEYMEPGARIAAHYEESRSEYLDPAFFPQFHAHTHNYYHVRVGGGASRNLFVSAMAPIQYREGFELPKIGPRTQPAQIRAAYDYLLIRSASGEGARSALPDALVVGRSGHWTLVDATKL